MFVVLRKCPDQKFGQQESLGKALFVTGLLGQSHNKKVGVDFTQLEERGWSGRNFDSERTSTTFFSSLSALLSEALMAPLNKEGFGASQAAIPPIRNVRMQGRRGRSAARRCGGTSAGGTGGPQKKVAAGGAVDIVSAHHDDRESSDRVRHARFDLAPFERS
jgi:hypothetical protein